MKKFISILILGISLIAWSCSKVSTKDYAETIVGKWELYKATDFDGVTGLISEVDADSPIYFTFTESGQFIMEEYDDGIPSSVSTANYRIENNTLYLSGGGHSTSIPIYKLTHKELVFHFVDESNSDLEWMYFKRVE